MGKDDFTTRFAAPWSVGRTRDLLLHRAQPGWSGARLVVFTTEVDDTVAREWLPPGLTPSRPARATVFVADYPETTFGVVYREAGVLLHATRFGVDVLHAAWMVVDDDRALVLGRELLGFPKKLAVIDFELDTSTGRCTAAVRRLGAELLTVSATPHWTRERGNDDGGTRVPFQHPIVNVCGLPGPLPAMLLGMRVPQRVREGWGALCDVTTAGSAADPLQLLGIGARRIGGVTMIADIGVPPTGARGLLPPLFPVGLVSPRWLASRYPFRVW